METPTDSEAPEAEPPQHRGDPEANGHPGEAAELPEEAYGHPRGTLAIVLIYGALFALGWALLYFVEFVPRGVPSP